MKIRQAVAVVLVALLIPLSASKCATGSDTSKPPPGGPVAEQPCDDSCTTRDDVLTVTCVWADPQLSGKLEGVAEVAWSKAGVQQNPGNDRMVLPAAGTHYAAWVPGWKKQGYPDVSVTCDATILFVKVTCALRYFRAGKPIYNVDTHIVARPPVKCDTAAWLNQYLNQGD